MKKQVRKITKKIIILSLATSLIFTTCFSHKKIEAHAASIAATLSAFTLYEVCLYIGGLAITALGIGYAYDNRDEIAEFGKSVIDSMGETIPETGWMIGSYSGSESCVYGAEVFEAVQNAAWDYIEAGGLSPSTATDLTGDGYVDISDRDFELTQTKYWTTTAGMDAITGYLEGIYDSWVNKEEDNILDEKYGAVDQLWFDGTLPRDSDGNYIGTIYVPENDFTITAVCPNPLSITCYWDSEKLSYYFTVLGKGATIIDNTGSYTNFNSMIYDVSDFANPILDYPQTNLPVFSVFADYVNFRDNGIIQNVVNYRKSFQVADWIDEAGTWMATLEDIATALRPLQDVSDIAAQLSSAALELSATADIYRDLALDLADTYVPAIDAVIDPVYWPDTNATPALDAADLPNADVANPDIPVPDDPGSDDPDDPEIELDTGGLLSLFNILFYIIMIIIMLIYLFLACLAFIVMIFRIPASSTMLPEDMVLGFEHLKTIMIPGMNISIYGFAMALIYMFIIFAVIKALRLEINDFKIPRSFKK